MLFDTVDLSVRLARIRDGHDYQGESEKERYKRNDAKDEGDETPF